MTTADWSPYPRFKAAKQPTNSQAGANPPLTTLLLAAIVALSVVGYPVAGVLGAVLGIESFIASATFRIFVDLIAVVAVYLVVINRERLRLDLIVVAFLVLYLARLVWDMQRPEFTQVTRDIAFYLASAFIPAIGVGLIATHWNDQLVARLTFIIGLTAAVMVMFLRLTGFYAVTTLTEASGRLTLEAVNPITLGQLGTSVILSALVLLSGSRSWFRASLFAGMGVGVWVLVEANSRSPFLSLGVAVAAYMIAKAQWRRLALLAGAGLTVLIGGNVLDRLQGSRLVTIADRSVDDRFFVQRNALNDFLDHPFFGAGYLDSYSLFYPHNIWLESAMALGVAGFVILSIATIATMARTFQAFRSDNTMLGFLFWQAAVLASVSSPLFQSGVIFILMMTLTRLYPIALVTYGAPARRNAASPNAERPRVDEVKI